MATGGLVPAAPEVSGVPVTLSRAGGQLPLAVGDAIDRFAFHEGLGLVWDFVGAANKFVADTAPWALARARDGGAGTVSAEAAAIALKSCLSELVDALYVIALCCRPFLPATGARLLSQLGADPRLVGWPTTPVAEDALAGNRVSSGDLLFPRLEDKEDRKIGDETMVG